MTRFIFQLERVLHVRALQEEVTRMEWQAAERAAAQAEQLTRERVAERDAAVAHLGQVRSEVAPKDILWRLEAIDRMTRAATSQRERARTLRFQADQARVPWQERRAQVRGLERLRERRLLAHHEALSAAETKELDELAGARAARRRRLEELNHKD